MTPRRRRYWIDVLHRPARLLGARQLEKLREELREVAGACFDEIPDYQCLGGNAAALDDKVIALARRADGRLVGFCSAVLLPVRDVGTVLHLGLTCIRPEDRGAGLTHKLTAKLLLRRYLASCWQGRLWVTNVACVLSSLGSVALSFDGVYPSPLRAGPPSSTHLRIADAIDREHRSIAYIDERAQFDRERFVFSGSVLGTVFQKRSTDARYQHRMGSLNDFYRELLCFETGDEVLQVGWVSLATVVGYLIRRVRRLRHNRWTEIQPRPLPGR